MYILPTSYEFSDDRRVAPATATFTRRSMVTSTTTTRLLGVTPQQWRMTDTRQRMQDPRPI